MNARERVVAALQGRPGDECACGPLAVHFTAADSGVSLLDYATNATVLSDCVLRYFEKYRPDAVWVSADTWVVAEAMGAEVFFPEDQPAGGIGGSVRGAADLDRIAPADPSSQGRLPLMVEAVGRARRAQGDEVFIVGCLDQSPFSLSCALLGIGEAMVAVLEDRSLLDATMERALEYGVAYGAALAEAGADMLSTGDSPAGLLAPAQYEEVALPYERRLFAELKRRTGKYTSLHICGDASHVLSGMCTAGSDVLELDCAMDMDAVCGFVPGEIAVWGNLDPVGLLLQGTPDAVAEAAYRVRETVASHGRNRFVLSSGCTLSPNTPQANLHALIAAAR